MALKDKVPALLAHIKSHMRYLDHNTQILDVYNGNLLPVIDKAIAPPRFSQSYYDQIKERIIPINVLKRISDKSARAYVSKPERITQEKYKDTLSFYENIFYLDVNMQMADVYGTGLFKGFALEPFVHKGIPKLRILPYDRFLPYSDDETDNTVVTEFIKFMGKRKRQTSQGIVMREVFHIYSDNEFISIDEEGETVEEDLVLNDGINPYGVIPFIYGNRGNDELIPTQDTDTLSLTKMIPLLLTDLSGAIMFQCFSIVYGINVDSKNLTMSPNAFWDLKSDLVATGTGSPTVGTIKPEADIDKVLQFIMSVFTFWLETRGIRVGAVGNVEAASAASGISKIIDEMDATELIQKSQQAFKQDEYNFWQLIKVMNNYWVSKGMLNTAYKPGLLLNDFEVVTQFDPPQPMQDRMSEVNTVKTERDAGFISTKQAIMQLYPDLTLEQVEEQMLEIESEHEMLVKEPQTEVVQDNIGNT